MAMTYDFSGWATKNDIKCSDGRTIRKNAFIENDGMTVPLVWNHRYDDPMNVLGHALLQNRDEGVYAYCSFNDTESGRNAKDLVQHGDVVALSIYANKLKQNGGNVLHGAIREVSLVLAGANPGAVIESVMRHGEESDEEADIYYLSENSISLEHGEIEDKKENTKMPNTSENNGKTVKDVFDTLTEEQKTVVYALIGQALEDAGKNSNEEGDKMKHNAFDDDYEEQSNVLSHSDMEAIIKDGKRLGSLKEAFLSHGIDNIQYLFPEDKQISNTPDWVKRDTEWVSTVMGGVHHTPFSRVKSAYADITADDARARGYIKGNMKVEEFFALFKRNTSPTTIYKKQKLDRDDVIDITDFDVVAWLKGEMRIMLDEEIARAILVGDGRSASSDDKISDMCIRPIWTDNDVYTIHKEVALAPSATPDQRAKALIRAAIKCRKEYKGSGTPTLFTTEDALTDMLLMEDSTGRVIYETTDKLATALRVAKIVTVPVMEDLTRTNDEGHSVNLWGILVNLNDYNVGADKGGAVNMFDDFDIDYNAQKYLIETRCSGALIKPYSAVALEIYETN